MSHNICPKCEGDISLSWLLFSTHWTKYRCVNCSALIQWNSRRQYLAFFIGLTAYIFMMLLKEYIPSLFLRFVIVVVAMFILMLAVPKQFELSEDEE